MPPGHRRSLSVEGWRRLFTAAFKRSRNAMVLANDRRAIADVNRAACNLLRRQRADVIGKPLREFVHGNPRLSEDEWQELMRRDESIGAGELVLPDGGTVKVHWASHGAVVTGTQLVLFVVLSTYRAGRYFRRDVDEEHEDEVLSERELEIVRLVAMGYSGPEIAEQLHITHNTVRTHVHNAMLKTSARSRAHLVAKAMGAGLVLV